MTIARIARRVDSLLPVTTSYALRRLVKHRSVSTAQSFDDFVERRGSYGRSSWAKDLLKEYDFEAFFQEAEARLDTGNMEEDLINLYARACMDAGEPERLVARASSLPASRVTHKNLRKHLLGALILLDRYDEAAELARQTLALGAYDKDTLLRLIADAHLLAGDSALEVAAGTFFRNYGAASVRERLFVLNILLNRQGIDALNAHSVPISGASVDTWLFKANVARAMKQYSMQVDLTNEALASFRLRPVELIDSSKPVSAKNLKAAKAPRDGGEKVTVLMATFNAATVVESALRSLSNQDYQNIEIIVVDDCSTDDTAEVVRKYAKTEPRLRFIQQETNEGPYRARNIGLTQGTGKYFTVNDCDDWSHPQKISTLVDAITGTDNVAVQGQLLRVSEKFGYKPKIRGYVHPDQSSFMFRRAEILSEVGGFDEHRFGADSEFAERIYAKYGRNRVRLLPEPFLFSDWSPKSASGALTTGITDGGLMAPVRNQYKARYRRRHRSGENLIVPVADELL